MSPEHYCSNLHFLWLALTPPWSRQADDFIPVSKLRNRHLSKYKTFLVPLAETCKSCITQVETAPNALEQWNVLFYTASPQSNQRAHVQWGAAMTAQKESEQSQRVSFSAQTDLQCPPEWGKRHPSQLPILTAGIKRTKNIRKVTGPNSQIFFKTELQYLTY